MRNDRRAYRPPPTTRHRDADLRACALPTSSLPVQAVLIIPARHQRRLVLRRIEEVAGAEIMAEVAQQVVLARRATLEQRGASPPCPPCV
jgi:hypothetical protein